MSIEPPKRSGLQLLQVHVDDAGVGAPVLGREVARHELDVVDDPLGQHAAQTAEVIDQRHVDPVDEDLRVLGRRAAHDEQAAAGGRARHARQVLDHRQRIARGAGDPVDDVGAQHHVRHVLLGARGRHRLVERVGLPAFDVVGDDRLLAGADLFVRAERQVRGRFDVQVPGAGGEFEEGEPAVAVGGRLVGLGRRRALFAGGHDEADERRAGAALAQHARQALARRRRRGHSGRRRRHLRRWNAAGATGARACSRNFTL